MGAFFVLFFPHCDMTWQKKKAHNNKIIKCFSQCGVGWVKDYGKLQYDLLSVLSSGNCLGCWRYLLWPFLSTLLLFQSRQALAHEHTLAFLGCLSWFVLSRLIFFLPPYPSPQLSSALFHHRPLLTPCHIQRHPFFFFLPTLLTSAIALWWRQESNRRSICIYITHVMCSVLLWLGLNSMVSTWHFGNRMPVISSPHPKAHFTWNLSGIEPIFNATCPGYPLSAISISSPHLTTKPSCHSVLCGKIL